MRDWRYGSGSAYLKADLLQLCFSLLGGEFECHRPSGGFAGGSQFFLESAAVKFDDYTVNVVAQFVSLRPVRVPV